MFTKEPSEILDFQMAWADWLGSLTITTSTWSAPAGITINAGSISGTSTTVRVSGGTWAQSYELSNTITASNGESETRRFTVKIQRSVAYCSTSEVRRRATQATETAISNTELEALIEQASRMFDLECGVEPGYFNEPLYPDPTELVLYGDGTNFLPLPPYVPGTLETEVSVPAGYTAPAFIERHGYLVLSSNGSLVHRIAPFPSYGDGWFNGVPITVTAKWGFEQTPADVKMAVLELVINLWRETDPASLKLVAIDNQPLREKIPPRVLEVARKYRMKGAAFV